MSRPPAHLMWADALALMSRAEQLRRGFFQPVAAGWEPPVDLLETEGALVIVVALPGVAANDVELVVGGGEIAIQGLRRLPPALRSARVHRMELPQGRFERRVALPPGTFELSRRELADGCLTIVLRKVA
ncbi:heat-shock protein Hsp20 [Pseudoroseomonas deserti]|uniref:Heat-shock protein Hsp20 n=1 Tax=Teichococcus deserti TaxID=1817963 RepID=A0A1V2H6L8_9PROT|nr:Hsp20/alpha crystallin family protein [Pseudoroseomonas deserti]ONG55773.1 heat-shock protein Hsp20 [Pseudoroseomonas deserti]